MALSMDEQRMLAEIEKRLAADDPGLASCLSTFRRPGPGTVLRSPRARIIGSLFTVLLVAMVSLMVYAMIPFRAHTVHNNVTPPAQASSNTSISAVGTQQPSTKPTLGGSAQATTVNQSNVSPSGPSALKAQGTRAKPTSASAVPRAQP
jgi:Protein of unknown function (DUF3040)